VPEYKHSQYPDYIIPNAYVCLHTAYPFDVSRSSLVSELTDKPFIVKAKLSVFRSHDERVSGDSPAIDCVAITFSSADLENIPALIYAQFAVTYPLATPL